MPRTVEPVARIDIALISVDARTSWPDGSVPIRSRDPASSLWNRPGPTSTAEATWAWATPSTHTWSGCAAIGNCGLTKRHWSAELSEAPRV